MKGFVAGTLLACFAFANPVWADDFEDGLHAAWGLDYVGAYEIWLPLAENGNTRAQYSIGELFADRLLTYNDGEDRDYREAVRWFRMAAEAGSPQGQYHLGQMYHMGRGVMADFVLAYMWANIAYGNGLNAAAISRDNAASFLDAAQIAEAQALARACVAAQYRDCD